VWIWEDLLDKYTGAMEAYKNRNREREQVEAVENAERRASELQAELDDRKTELDAATRMISSMEARLSRSERKLESAEASIRKYRRLGVCLVILALAKLLYFFLYQCSCVFARPLV
jgi:hypothetical protein